MAKKKRNRNNNTSAQPVKSATQAKTNTVEVIYDKNTLETLIAVNGKSFDTSRINGKEIADWAYPFMMRKICWNGFYEEMVQALGGQKAFDLVFEGSEEALIELREAWKDAPVNIISKSSVGNVVTITYNENNLKTAITVNGQPFDTSRINGKEIADWVYPFMMRKVKWDGIFEELAKAVGSQEYAIRFSGSNVAMDELIEACPESVSIQKDKEHKTNSVTNNSNVLQEERILDILTRFAYYMVESTTAGNEDLDTLILNELSEEDTDIIMKLVEAGNPVVEFFASFNTEDDEPDIVMLEKSAKKGFAPSEFLYAIFIISSEDYDTDYTLIAEYLNESTNDPVIKKAFSDCVSDIEDVANELDKKERYEESFALRKAIEKYNNRISISNIGWHYHYGKGVKQDYVKAFEWYKKAAEQGDAWAQNKIGWLYQNGYGVTQDYAKAFEWYKKAAEQGNADAQGNLGFFYYNGYGVVQNYAKAFEWYKKAAEQGNAWAQNKLGWLYQNGYGVTQDYAKAFEWYKKAAEQGNADAQGNVGFFYDKGYYVKQSWDKAFEWYKKAAEQGVAWVQGNLGFCYQYGYGVTQDYAKAFEWYKKGAEQGNAWAQNKLGNCYQYGYGVTQDYAKAFEWYQKAAEQGDTDAQENIKLLNSNSSSSEGFLDKALKFASSDKGKSILGILGNIGGAFIKGYSQASSMYKNDDYDDNDYDYDDYDDDYD